METLIQDLHYGTRMLFKSPAFATVAIVTLALGIGANTAIFSVVNAVLLRQLPYQQPDRLERIWVNNTRLKLDQDWHSWLNLSDYREQNRVFEKIAAFTVVSFNLTGGEEPERVVGARASSDLFPLLGIAPALGRTFTAEEDTYGKDQVVVLAHGLWQRRFGSDKNILGRKVSIDGLTRSVIGVMPTGFYFPSKDCEIWLPLAPHPQHMTDPRARGAPWLQAIGRLKPGVSVRQAQAEMSAIAKRLEQLYPEINSGYGVTLLPLHEQIVGSIRPALLVLMGAVVFVLLVACSNVANLQLARAAAREREIAIRGALGAGRLRLVRQLLTESALLSLFGGALGVLIAHWGLRLLVAISPADIPRLDQTSIDGWALGFTLGISLLTPILFGLAPALQASKPTVSESLKEGGRSLAGGMRGNRLRNVLVVCEVALSLALLIGAGLMIKSFRQLQNVNLGFNPDRLLTLQLQLPGSKYGEDHQVRSFYQHLLSRVATLPGVKSAGGIETLFLSKNPNSGPFYIEGRPVLPAAQRIEATLDSTSPNYFQVMGIPMLKGRHFTDRDAQNAPPVVIINETMARRFWPDDDPIGKRFKYGVSPEEDRPWMSVVGVLVDTHRSGLDVPVRFETFVPYMQRPRHEMTLVVRATSDALVLASSVRNAIWELDKDQPAFKIKTMDELLDEMIAQRRVNVLLLAVFAGVALILAAVGIYGVMSFCISCRTHEIGIRMALGAQRIDTLKLVLGHAMFLVLIGLALGLANAFVLTRVLTSLLYEITATDPIIYLGASLLLFVVVLIASYIPARKATKVDPMVALRHE